MTIFYHTLLELPAFSYVQLQEKCVSGGSLLPSNCRRIEVDVLRSERLARCSSHLFWRQQFVPFLNESLTLNKLRFCCHWLQCAKCSKSNRPCRTHCDVSGDIQGLGVPARRRRYHGWTWPRPQLFQRRVFHVGIQFLTSNISPFFFFLKKKRPTERSENLSEHVSFFSARHWQREQSSERPT